MFKRKDVQKENRISYFFGGTAIGIAAGLLATKLFSKSSSEETQNIEPEVFVNKKVNNYSQDDNIYNPNFHKTKNKNYAQQEFSRKPSKEFDNIQDDINNFDSNYECDKILQKDLYDKKIDMLYKNKSLKE